MMANFKQATKLIHAATSARGSQMDQMVGQFQALNLKRDFDALFGAEIDAVGRAIAASDRDMHDVLDKLIATVLKWYGHFDPRFYGGINSKISARLGFQLAGIEAFTVAGALGHFSITPRSKTLGTIGMAARRLSHYYKNQFVDMHELGHAWHDHLTFAIAQTIGQVNDSVARQFFAMRPRTQQGLSPSLQQKPRDALVDFSQMVGWNRMYYIQGAHNYNLYDVQPIEQFADWVAEKIAPHMVNAFARRLAQQKFQPVHKVLSENRATLLARLQRIDRTVNLPALVTPRTSTAREMQQSATALAGTAAAYANLWERLKRQAGSQQELTDIQAKCIEPLRDTAHLMVTASQLRYG
jgi:hypothetical protein